MCGQNLILPKECNFLLFNLWYRYSKSAIKPSSRSGNCFVILPWNTINANSNHSLNEYNLS